MDIITSLWSPINVLPKYQKLFSANNSLIWWVELDLTQPRWMGLVWPTPKKKKTFVGQDQPNLFELRSAQHNHSLAESSTADIFIIILYIKTKFPKTKLKSPLKKIVIVSNVFLPILYNIGLYIYTVKYKSGIKILDFLRNNF